MDIGRELNDVNLVVAVILIIMAISIAVDLLIFENITKSIRRKWGMAGENL